MSFSPERRESISCSSRRKEALTKKWKPNRRRFRGLSAGSGFLRVNRMSLLTSAATRLRRAAAIRLCIRGQIGRLAGLRRSPAPASAFREGANVLLTRSEEIQKVHAHVFAGLADAQQGEILLHARRSRSSLRVSMYGAPAMAWGEWTNCWRSSPVRPRTLTQVPRPKSWRSKANHGGFCRMEAGMSLPCVKHRSRPRPPPVRLRE